MAEQTATDRQWSEVQLWRTPTVLQTNLSVRLVGPISTASLECFTLSGDDPLVLDEWTFQLVGFDQLLTACIDTITSEIKRQLRNVSPF